MAIQITKKSPITAKVWGVWVESVSGCMRRELSIWRRA